MSLRFFEGPAGSGKTTALMEGLKTCLLSSPLADYQKVLALTKIHGSRRRLDKQLGDIPELNRRFECMTADSYARRLLSRWRSLALIRFGNLPTHEAHDEYCKQAGELLEDDVVNRWVARTYPIIVVDEMQDSKGGQLRMFQALARSTVCLAAADDFQDLEADGENEGVIWARRYGEVISLQQIHRTQVGGLLDAARAVREGKKISNGVGFEIVSVPKSQLGAWFLSKHITSWRRDGNIAVITPAGFDSAPFVRELITRVEREPIGKTYTFGPHAVPWESSSQDTFSKIVADLKLPDNPNEKINSNQLEFAGSNGISAAITRWLDRQRKISSKTVFTVSEIRAQINLIQQRIRSFGYTKDRKVSAMTIHQAKNREFDSVIVLWPFQIQGTAEKHRRLLYNAITRAKKQVLVVVHDPKNIRLSLPPFSPSQDNDGN